MFVSCTFSGAAWLLRMATLFPGPQIPHAKNPGGTLFMRYYTIDIDIDREIDRYVYIYINK